MFAAHFFSLRTIRMQNRPMLSLIEWKTDFNGPYRYLLPHHYTVTGISGWLYASVDTLSFLELDDFLAVLERRYAPTDRFELEDDFAAIGTSPHTGANSQATTLDAAFVFLIDVIDR